MPLKFKPGKYYKHHTSGKMIYVLGWTGGEFAKRHPLQIMLISDNRIEMTTTKSNKKNRSKYKEISYKECLDKVDKICGI